MRERERERERRREYLAGSYYYNEMRIALHTCLPDNFLVCWPPVSALSVFHGNLPQEIWGTYFPHRESTSWNFPAKIRNSLRLIPSFDMLSKFPGSDHSSRRRYVALLLAERRNSKNNEIYICEAICYAVREWSEVTRPSADCQTTFLDVSSNKKNIWKKSLNGHATVVGGHATVDWLSNNVFWTFQAIWENFEKSRWTVTRQWLRSRDRRTTVKQRFLDVSSNLGNFEKSRWTVTRQWSEVTRPSADCQTKFFRRFKQLEFFLKKVAWTVTRQWSEVTRLSADCQTTFFGRFKRFGKILKKVAERSRDSGWGHATVGRLSNNVFWTFQAIRKFFEKSRWTVTRQWTEVTRPSADCQTTFLDVSSN